MEVSNDQIQVSNNRVHHTNIRTLYFHNNIFSSYISDEGEAGFKRLLCYMTCAEEIAPLGIRQKIKVSYVNQSNFFAETCLYELKIPIVHESLEDLEMHPNKLVLTTKALVLCEDK